MLSLPGVGGTWGFLVSVETVWKVKCPVVSVHTLLALEGLLLGQWIFALLLEPSIFVQQILFASLVRYS